MARIIVMADTGRRVRSASELRRTVLLDEHVSSIHLRDDHSAEQLVQRLAWAVDDAERAELSQNGRPSTATSPEGQFAEGSRARHMALSGMEMRPVG